jgi:hypothetical protein
MRPSNVTPTPTILALRLHQGLELNVLKLDDLLLTVMNPTRKNRQQQLPRL